MPCQKTQEETGLYLRYHGEVTAQEIDAESHAIRTLPELGKLQHVIADFSDVESLEVDQYAALLCAYRDYEALAEANKRLRVAIVATAANLLSPIERYASSPLMHFRANVFSSLPDARAWLASPPSLDDEMLLV